MYPVRSESAWKVCWNLGWEGEDVAVGSVEASVEREVRSGGVAGGGEGTYVQTVSGEGAGGGGDVVEGAAGGRGAGWNMSEFVSVSQSVSCEIKV